MVREEGVEPSTQASDTWMLPLHYTLKKVRQHAVPVHRLGMLSGLHRSVRLEVPALQGCNLVVVGVKGVEPSTSRSPSVRSEPD
jgi:hypothetical protein